MKDYIVKKKITINAEPAVVWDALTNPEKTKEYFFNCRVDSDWKTGSRITFKGHMFWFIPIEMEGEIVKAQPGKLLKYTLKNKGSDSISTVTDELSYHDGKTTLAISDDVGDGDGAEKRYERSKDGWEQILHGLKEFVEESN